MSALNQLWTKIVSFAKAFEDIDDPKGDYIMSLGKRVERLERDVDLLSRSSPSRASTD